jgi:2-polyprenyl-3-methyl-5-hydroxy-6-metoxy-1,4-benzoquinol methylase
VKALDRWLQSWRIAKARRWIPNGARVLDVGCADGALFRQLSARVREGVGVDPDLPAAREWNGYRLVPGVFPDVPVGPTPFDAITMLAVLEHVPRDQQTRVARGCAAALAPGGRLIISTPAPLVDRILDVLAFLRLIDGMSLEEHYGFEPAETPRIFEAAGLELEHHGRFQLGLNHLFVLRKS